MITNVPLWWRDADNGGAVHVCGGGYIWKRLYFSLNFAVNPKLLQKIESTKKFPRRENILPSLK